MISAPSIAPDEDGKSVGFEWWNGNDTVWMDWEDDGSIMVLWRHGETTETKRFKPGDGFAMCEFLARAFQIINI